MCGIAGLVHKSGRPVARAEIERLTDLVAHRGPDRGDTYLNGNVALGHRRLAIIDLSSEGDQPMHLADAGFTIVFNGEIYNYIELRSELQGAGHVFRTGTDTEVILAAYGEWGEQCVEHFNGMWGFAIHDRRRNILFMSRDRFGVKPFHYLDTDELFAFGSEITQLLSCTSNRSTDLQRVSAFLLTGGLDLDNNTFFRAVRKLPAGSNGVLDLSSGHLRITAHYGLRRTSRYAGIGVGDAVALYGETFRDAVRLRMRADVKVGTCLSGGLDSSSVATVASEFYQEAGVNGFNAITAVSEDSATDETFYAERVVQNSRLAWLKIRPTYRDFTDTLDAIVRSQQEPFGSPSLTMQYFVMKTARENGVKVLLDGQAGDETLLGYDRYYPLYLAHLLRQYGWGAVVAGLRSMRLANAHMSYPRIARYVLGGSIIPFRMMGHRREQPSLRSEEVPSHLRRFGKAMKDPFQLQQLEIESTNLPVLLRYEDRNSMAHGIEARLPFLDYRLVELSLNLPLELKIRDGWTKWILRKAFEPYMPREITWRRNKFSFNAPDDIWLRLHNEEMKSSVFQSTLIDAVCDGSELRKGFDLLSNTSKWRLYSAALWQEAFGVTV